jgi:DNA (cytosine-5)-methyltransferase 1
METPTFPLTFSEYFAGIGLVRMGLQPFGWQVVFANDISDKKYEMYKTFFSDADLHYKVEDVFNIDPASIPLTTLATCSFPCIDLSLAGNMNGLLDGKHSSAFWGFIKILKEQKDKAPPFVLVENVPGWLYSNNGQDFRITIQALNKLGYACDVFALDALRFRPQSRLRIFLIGTKLSSTKTTAELILTRPKSLLTERLRRSIVANKDLRWFYNPIPNPPPLHRNGLYHIIEDIDDENDKWWNQEKVDRHLNMMKQDHLERVLSLSKVNNISYRTFYRRRREGQQRAEVRNDELSGCLRTAVGGSGKQFLIKAGNDRIQMRAMTPREYARLQGVPDSYPIKVNGVQALTGFGDAVCVPAISWIAENVLSRLALNPFDELVNKTPVAQLFLLDKNER